MGKRLPELTLSIQYPAGRDHAPARAQVRRWVRAATPVAAEIAVRFVGTGEGRALNLGYRGKDYATNVLSFAYRQDERIVGDLVLCVPVVQDEAAVAGTPPEAHWAHLIVHGMLHLQGYDHETGRRDAARMEARERDILAGLGYPDPYR